MSNREDLIGGAERYLRRKLTDDEIQQLIHASDSYRFGNNDALWMIISMLEANKWSLGETLESYRGEFEAIPKQIKEAADAERESLKATADVAAIQAQDRINDSVLALLPNIRADIKSVVGRSASTAIRRIELGRGMFSLWGGGMIAAALIILGILIDSGVYRYVFTHPKQVQAFQTIYGWQIAIALSLPPFLGLGLYALENDYSSESKFAGWLIIIASVVGFLIPGLKVMGWWFWK
jgi:hypothetical protein